MNKLQNTIEGITQSIESYRFNEACHSLYDFIWHEFCDWYIEAKKAGLYQSEDLQLRSDALALSSFLLASILKLLHPIMPFITEEIYSHLKAKVTFAQVTEFPTIVEAPWPVKQSALTDPNIENRFSLIKSVIVALRTIKSENNVPPDKWGSAVIITSDKNSAVLLQSQAPLINRFAKLTETVIAPNAEKPKFAGSAVVDGHQLYISFEGLIDPDVEIDRLTKEAQRLRSLAEGTKKRLENGNFVHKAPAVVVEKEREKLNGLLMNLEKVEHNLAALSDLRR